MITSGERLIASQPGRVTTGRSIVLVIICTLIGAVAQVFMKVGGSHIDPRHLAAVVTNLPLITGYSLYGINTVLLMMALREGELSKLYPIIALTYVWVNILSMWIFHEQINIWKALGIAVIMAGVTLLGRASE